MAAAAPTPDELIDKHIELVGIVVGQLRRSQYLGHGDVEDAFQEGRIALWKAIEHYDPERGVDWVPYACILIRRAITKHVGRERATRKMFLEKVRGWARVHGLDRLGIDVTADQLDLELLRVADGMSRLERPEAEVLRLRFGLDRRRSHTLASLGRRLGCSTSHASTRVQRALEALREVL